MKKKSVEEKLNDIFDIAGKEAVETAEPEAPAPKKKRKYVTSGPPHYSGKGKDGKSWRPTKENPVKNPKVIVDEVEIERLAYLGVPVSDMARFFGLDNTYLAQRIESELPLRRAKERGEARYRIDLRDAQRKVALDPKNFKAATMLIWLGKQDLGQRETPVEDNIMPTKIEFVFPAAPLVERPPQAQITSAEVIDVTPEPAKEPATDGV